MLTAIPANGSMYPPIPEAVTFNSPALMVTFDAPLSSILIPSIMLLPPGWTLVSIPFILRFTPDASMTASFIRYTAAFLPPAAVKEIVESFLNL